MNAYPLSKFTPSPYTPDRDADLRPFAATVMDQGQTGACVDFGIRGWAISQLNYAGIQANFVPFDLYDRARAADGIIGDVGCIPATALRIIANEGLLADDGSHWKITCSKVTVNPDSMIGTAHNISMALSEHRFVFTAMDVQRYFFSLSGELSAQSTIDLTAKGALDYAGGHAGYFVKSTHQYLGFRSSYSDKWGFEGDGAISVSSMNKVREAEVIDTITDGKGNVYDFTFTQNKAEVAALYAVLFDRMPEKSGLEYWANKVKLPGNGMDTIAQDMINLAGIDNLVSKLYSAVGRVGDAEGVAHWNNQLQHFSSGHVVADFIHIVDQYNGQDAQGIKANQVLDSKIFDGLDYAVMQQNNCVAIVGQWSDGGWQRGLAPRNSDYELLRKTALCQPDGVPRCRECGDFK